MSTPSKKSVLNDVAQIELAKSVSSMGIHARHVDDQIWFEGFSDLLEANLKGSQIGRVTGSIWQINVQIASHFCKGKIARPVHRESEDA
mgnify:CR=1 FL=1